MASGTAAVYASSFGHTKRVVGRFLELVTFKATPVRLPASRERLESFDTFVLFCPTYGDEELQPDFECFLVELGLRDRRYALCELGNYYGYEDPRFGPARIVPPVLAQLGWRELCEPLSLDSLPRIDWPKLHPWARQAEEALHA